MTFRFSNTISNIETFRFILCLYLSIPYLMNIVPAASTINQSGTPVYWPSNGLYWGGFGSLGQHCGQHILSLCSSNGHTNMYAKRASHLWWSSCSWLRLCLSSQTDFWYTTDFGKVEITLTNWEVDVFSSSRSVPQLNQSRYKIVNRLYLPSET